MDTNEQPIQLDKDDARGGATPHIVRYVLIISIALAVLAMSAVWMTGALNAPDDTGGTADTAKAVQEQAQKDAAK